MLESQMMALVKTHESTDRCRDHDCLTEDMWLLSAVLTIIRLNHLCTRALDQMRVLAFALNALYYKLDTDNDRVSG